MSGQERLKDLKNKFNRLLHSFVPGRRRSPSLNHPTGPSFLLLLPSELKHRIAELSSRGSLASLARTHTAFQREAEQALYRTLSDPSVKCLETLARNSEKSGFVHFLTIECLSSSYRKKKKKKEDDDPWQALVDYLLSALVNMHCLSVFRLRLPPTRSLGYGIQPWIKRAVESLDKILCNDHFRLKTLCYDEALDLSRIITSQTKLQKLGIYRHCGNDIGFLGTLKQLRDAQVHLPVVFALDYDYYGSEKINRISIFPPFYDCHLTVHRVLADTDQESYSTLIDALDIYLVDSCDLPSIQVFTKNMTMTFPNITSLTFSFENPCEDIPSQEIKKIISLFPDLSKLDFEVWPPLDIGNGNISGDVERAHMALAHDWELVCPELCSVSFIDGSTLEKDGSWVRGEW